MVLATLDHELNPNTRRLIPAPIYIGNKVWIGAGAIITKGVIKLCGRKHRSRDTG
ncbi:MAG: hypothetical protein K6B68_04550 [Eubacterium sp.]|nr:hypothetical protein [Eubacterium sp.]